MQPVYICTCYIHTHDTHTHSLHFFENKKHSCIVQNNYSVNNESFVFYFMSFVPKMDSSLSTYFVCRVFLCSCPKKCEHIITPRRLPFILITDTCIFILYPCPHIFLHTLHLLCFWLYD